MGADASDGFLESLTRWFEDETRDEDDDQSPKAINTPLEPCEGLLVPSSDPAVVHQEVKQHVAKSGFLELFSPAGISRLPPESLQILAKALVSLSRPTKWSASTGGSAPGVSGTAGVDAAVRTAAGRRTEAIAEEWHEVADPVFGLELLTNMTCMPFGPGQNISQIWPLVSTHFERLLQYVVSGGGSTERQFIERLIVNTLRLCIRLVGNAELVPTLLTLMQHLAKLPPRLFGTYSERIACGLLVLAKDTNLPHGGLTAIFTLLQRISDYPGGTSACTAGLEVLSWWLTDDQELSRLLSLQQFAQLLTTLKAFAMQNSTNASAAALGHLSSLVPQLAHGARCLPQATHDQWQSLWVPTLHALADIARDGSQKSSAQAFVYLQRLLLERGTELSLPWDQLTFPVWKECLEQVLFPLLQRHHAAEAAKPALPGQPLVVELPVEVVAARQASAAQLVCRVVLTNLHDWLMSSPEGFPLLFLRLLHILASEAAALSASREPLAESMKNLLLVISMDPLFQEHPSPQHGQTLLEAAWGVVDPEMPELHREVALILGPPEFEEPALAGAGGLTEATAGYPTSSS